MSTAQSAGEPQQPGWSVGAMARKIVGSKKPTESEKKSDETPAPPKRKESSRDTIESVIVAFILAFLFRTFEAEAFVIPTGSMAPTLMGRHKDVTCDQCGIQFTFGASDEMADADGPYVAERRVRHAMCPNCRHIMDVKDLPVFKGDRILVNKFAYEFGEPKRWDVVVFKYPEDPKTNYIKRLVGLPGDVLEIRQGNVYNHRNGVGEILRKDDPDKQKAIQILVYDNDHPERPLLEKGWPERWTGMKKAGENEGGLTGWADDADGWEVRTQERTYRLSADKSQAGPRWLRYRNIIPSEKDWDDLQEGRPLQAPAPQLITDFCGYNAYSGNFQRDLEEGLYWTGELTLNARVTVEQSSPGSQLTLELIHGNRRYRCRFDLATGKAELLMLDDLSRDHDEDKAQILASASTNVRGSGSWEMTFANVDDRLCLWIDDKLVAFDKSTDYKPYGNRRIQRPWGEDLVPIGIAAQGADVVVANLLIQRDIYYRSDFAKTTPYGGESQYHEIHPNSEFSLRQAVHNPEQYGDLYEANWVGADPDRPPELFQFVLDQDEFFMMGDNSPRSKDSRLWPQGPRGMQTTHRHAVPRNGLVGKAFFIYWPHGVPFLNDGKGYPDGKDSIFNVPIVNRWFYHTEWDPDPKNAGRTRVSNDYYPAFRVPFYPNVKRMERIR